ncbi:hypothetical protein [uncultured Photobacterium sp.]|uniref:hypothetical protein n=1 Tax=uncultured Photobacterium sp. TaxID=173973 RepID=UPI002630183F|nr:hypothetical protein [uncultured Photobacterium sp.]
MLVLLLSILLVAGICFYRYRCKQNNSRLQKQFNQVIGLRQLIHLLRFHRRQTHQLLSNLQVSAQDKMSLNESQAIQALMRTLINQAELAHKPMYRILMKRITLLLGEWPRYSLQRNQMSHGKAIRHVMYLIDDTITQGLLYAEKDPQFKHYQTIWPIVLNVIDSLSRFRYAIENYRPERVSAHQRELVLHASIIHRRLDQINQLSHHAPPTLALDKLRAEFDLIPLQDKNLSQNKELLYQYSLKLSDTIYLLFDMVLIGIAEEISVNLPPIPTENVQNTVIRLNTN